MQTSMQTFIYVSTYQYYAHANQVLCCTGKYKPEVFKVQTELARSVH